MSRSATIMRRRIVSAFRVACAEGHWVAAENLFCALESLDPDAAQTSLALACATVARSGQQERPINPERNRFRAASRPRARRKRQDV